jgi:hypothetical protein
MTGSRIIASHLRHSAETFYRQGSGHFLCGLVELSCDSMEYSDANTRDGFGIFMRRLIDESGYASVRMHKPGVGESQGGCSKADSERDGRLAGSICFAGQV